MSSTPTDPARLSPRAAGVLLVVISAVGFGSGALLVQPLYAGGMATLPVLFWRFAIGALLSWGYLALRAHTRAALRALDRRRAGVMIFLGVLYVGNSFAYFAALQVVPIALTSIITYLYPAMVAVMAGRFVRRLEGRRAWLALGMSILGVALAVGGIPAGEPPPLWGLGLALANALIYATWIILQARLAGDRPKTDRAAVDQAAGWRAVDQAAGWRAVDQAAGWRAVDRAAVDAAVVARAADRRAVDRAAVDRAGGQRDGQAEDPPDGQAGDPGDLLTVPPGDAETAVEVSTSTSGGGRAPDPAAAAAVMTSATAGTYAVLSLAAGASISPADVPAGLWPTLLAFGLVATALAIQAFYAGVKRVGAARASIVSTVEPVYTIAMAVILFGETLTPIQLLGGVLVIGGVIMAESGPRERASGVRPDRATARH